MSRSLAVTAIGADRPGIVAAVTGALLDLGCNLEDTAMSILRGQFAMVLVVAAPDDVAPSTLERTLEERTSARDVELVVAVRELHDTHESESPLHTWTVVVHGADRPGIVHGVATALADLDVNILDLTTRVADGASSLYSMLLEVTVPARVDEATLVAALDAVAARLGVTVAVHPTDADIL